MSHTSDVTDIVRTTRRVSVAFVAPVGAVVTEDGHSFSVEPVNPAAIPHRVRCGRCPWQATGDLAAVVDAIRRHSLAHQAQDAADRRRGAR
jgi:hypothetical protein